MKLLVPETANTRQNGYQTVPFGVYIHNLMFVFIFSKCSKNSVGTVCDFITCIAICIRHLYVTRSFFARGVTWVCMYKQAKLGGSGSPPGNF